MEIKVLGPGCVRCRGLDARVRKAVVELNMNASVLKVEDMQEILRYGVMRTPALVIDEQLVMSGELPTYTDLKTFLVKYIENKS